MSNPLDTKVISKLAEILDKSNLTELEYEDEGCRICLTRELPHPAPLPPVHPAPVPPAFAPAPVMPQPAAPAAPQRAAAACFHTAFHPPRRLLRGPRPLHSPV
mgnify:FL=1